MEPDDTARRVRYWRERRGLSRRACAELIGYSEGWLQKIEQGQRRLDRLPILNELARVLRIPVTELQGADPETGTVRELEEVSRRLHWLTTPNVSGETLQQLESLMTVYAREYEETDAATVYPAVAGQRRWVQELLGGQQPPRQRAHLFVLAGQLSALLGYLAFDAGQERVAALQPGGVLVGGGGRPPRPDGVGAGYRVLHRLLPGTGPGSAGPGA